MIKANHKKWAEYLFYFYLNGLLKKHFEKFILIGSRPSINHDKSLLILPNHFSWWDGFFIYKVIKNISDKKFHIMMLEHQLKKYWYFNLLGAYSINQRNPKSVLKSLNYTIELLNDKSNLSVIYPQGDIHPQEEKQIKLNKGVNYLCEKSDNEFQVLPTCFRIFYSNKKLPFVLFRFGKILSSFESRIDSSLIFKNFESNLIELFDNKNLPIDILYNDR